MKKKIIALIFYGLMGVLGAVGTGVLTEWATCALKNAGYICGKE